MGFTGDLAKLGNLVENLHALASVPARAATDSADGIADAIDRAWMAEEDPYGNAWADLADSTWERPRVGGILRREDDARTSVDVHPMRGAGLAIEINDYMGFHQGGFLHRGGVDVPARPVLPDGDELPDTWREAIEQATAEAFADTMGAA